MTWWESKENTWVTGTSGEVDLVGAWGSGPPLPTLSWCHHTRERTLQSPWKEKRRQSQWNLQLPFPSAAGIEIIRIITGNPAK